MADTILRERDAREWIARTLKASNAFDAVYTGAYASQDGKSAGDALAVAIEPMDSTLSDPWDSDGIADYVDCRLTLTFMARIADGDKADAAVERLFGVAANALTGSDLGGLAMPDFSKLQRWSWPKRDSDARILSAIFQFRYLVDEAFGVDV